MLEEYKIPKVSKTILVSIVCENFENHRSLSETKKSLRELKDLLKTLEISVFDEFIQNRKKLEAGTILGQGKLKEIAEMAHQEEIKFLVFDFELTAGQVKNIRKITNLEIIDRCNVILEIFARHARTREAKIQIEISRLEYLLPRLTAFWGHFTRIRGGIGHKGGEGEQQLELDRRIVRKSIKNYKLQLENIKKSRSAQNKRRKKNVITAALVGYTNAGKSSLLNRLCKVNVQEEEKLFVTLDATCRSLSPNSRPPMLLIDTVGFIGNLPTSLITGFRTTLESAEEAQLLLIICDISDPSYENHIKITNSFLDELGMGDKDKIIIFNKKDKLNNPFMEKIILKSHPESFVISALDPDDILKVRNHIINYFLNKQDHYDLFVPYDHGQIHSKLIQETNVMSRVNHQKGIYYRIRIPKFILGRLGISSYILGVKDKKPEEL